MFVKDNQSYDLRGVLFLFSQLFLFILIFFFFAVCEHPNKYSTQPIILHITFIFNQTINGEAWGTKTNIFEKIKFSFHDVACSMQLYMQMNKKNNIRNSKNAA